MDFSLDLSTVEPDEMMLTSSVMLGGKMSIEYQVRGRGNFT